MPVASRRRVVAAAQAASATKGSSSFVDGSTIGPVWCWWAVSPVVGCSLA